MDVPKQQSSIPVLNDIQWGNKILVTGIDFEHPNYNAIYILIITAVRNIKCRFTYLQDNKIDRNASLSSVADRWGYIPETKLIYRTTVQSLPTMCEPVGA